MQEIIISIRYLLIYSRERIESSIIMAFGRLENDPPGISAGLSTRLLCLSNRQIFSSRKRLNFWREKSSHWQTLRAAAAAVVSSSSKVVAQVSFPGSKLEECWAASKCWQLRSSHRRLALLLFLTWQRRNLLATLLCTAAFPPFRLAKEQLPAKLSFIRGGPGRGGLNVRETLWKREERGRRTQGWAFEVCGSAVQFEKWLPGQSHYENNLPLGQT